MPEATESLSSYKIIDILTPAATNYALDLFTPEEIDRLRIFDKNGKPYLRCVITDKDRPAKPEELVRQLILNRLLKDYGYPRERIHLEKGVYFGSTMAEKRADIVVTDANNPDTAYIIVELKKPKRREGLEQLKSYCNAEGSPIGDASETFFLQNLKRIVDDRSLQ